MNSDPNITSERTVVVNELCCIFKENVEKVVSKVTENYMYRDNWPSIIKILGIMLYLSFSRGGVLNFDLGTDVRPEVSTTTL